MTDVEKKNGDEPEPEAVEPEEVPSNWEFIDRIPSRDEVVKLLESLPCWWGVLPADYVDYVQALPSDKKIKVKVPTASGQSRKEEKWFSVVTLYFSVAGRMQMLREAQQRNGWKVDFTPEPITPTGVPGFLQMDERIVYREYVEIAAPQLSDVPSDPRPGTLWTSADQYQTLGRRPGMAWVPATGGLQAKGSNPYEKVETAARGRALAAWGFGVLPGSGVASLEEMLGVRQNAQALAGEADAAAEPPAGTRKADAKTVMSSVLQLTEEARQLTNREPSEMFQIVADWFRKAAALDVVKTRDGDVITELDLSTANMGTLRLAEREFRRRVQQIRGELAEQEAATDG